MSYLHNTASKDMLDFVIAYDRSGSSRAFEPMHACDCEYVHSSILFAFDSEVVILCVCVCVCVCHHFSNGR